MAALEKKSAATGKSGPGMWYPDVVRELTTGQHEVGDDGCVCVCVCV